MSWLRKPEQLEGTAKPQSNREVIQRIENADNGQKVELKPTRFDKALEYVLLNEGPYSNDPRDPGGATKFGIIQTEYEKYLGRKLTAEDVRDMPLSTAKAIYRKEFWEKIRGDSYATDAHATAIFDTAVNKGLGGCLSCIRFATGIPFDTVIPYSNNLLTALNQISAKDFVERMADAVLRYNVERIKKYPNMEWARNGWNNRANKLRGLA